MTDTTSQPGTPPANPAGGTPSGANQPAPVATAPAGTVNPAGTPAAGQPAAPAGTGPDAAAKLDLTQADLDRIVTDRLARERNAWETKLNEQNAKLAAIFGGKPDAPVDPAEALKAAHAERDAAISLADTAMVEALASAAGVQAARVPILAAMVDKAAALQGVDRANAAAVRAALDKAVQAKAAEFPEWKGSVLPASSGGDRQTPGSPSLDEQIAAANAAGNHRLAISLTRQKFARRQG